MIVSHLQDDHHLHIQKVKMRHKQHERALVKRIQNLLRAIYVIWLSLPLRDSPALYREHSLNARAKSRGY